MTRVIPITIDLNTCTSDSKIIMFRGDAVQFDFSFIESENINLTDVSKIRVICKSSKASRDEIWFSGESDNINTIYFNSDKTSGYAGNAILSVSLISIEDEEELVVCSCVMPYIIQESGYDGLFKASDGFKEQTIKTITEVGTQVTNDSITAINDKKDESISDIHAVVADVKEEIDNWSDQTSRLAIVEDNITDLQLLKANKGALHFNAGSLALVSNQNVKEFCWCFRFKISLEEWKKIDAQSLFIVANKFSGSDLGFGLRSLGSSSSFVDILAFQYCSTNQSNKTICRITEFSKYADEQWHSIVVCGFNNEIRLYVDGSFVNSGAVELETITPARPFTVSSRGTLMQYADIYQFNFDITSEDVPYTISDYQNGKPIPPKAFEYLKQNVAELPIDTVLKTGLLSTHLNVISHWDRNATITVSGNAITWTATETATGYPRAIVYRFAKALTGSGVLKIDIGNVSKTGTFDTMRIGFVDSAGTVSWPSIAGFGFDKGELSLSVPYTNGLVAIAIGTGSSWTAGDSFTIDYLKVEHKGAILALEDYTINRKVLDYSGYNNDATITGNVKGDIDNSITVYNNETLKDANLQSIINNKGTLHFNSGILVVGASGTTDKMPSTFSWCRTLNITQQQWSNVANGRHFDTNSSSSAKGLSIFKTSNRLGFKYGDGTFASGNILLSVDETNVIIDGKTHTLIIVGANERLRIYVDNILLKDVSVVGATTIPSTSYRYQIDRFTGKYSRIYNFNFDITSTNAPYTIADYQNSKPIPPKAFYGQDSFVGGIEQSYSWLRTGLTMTSNITFDENGTNFIFDNTQGTSAEYQVVAFSVNIPKGAYLTAEGDWSNIYSVFAYNNSTSIGQIISTGNITSLTLSADCTSLRIRPLSTPAGSNRTITLPPSCKIKVNGATLALEDYTFNGEVLDYSGNNNHATITGDVKGDNDTKVETLYQKIASRISNNI